MRQAGEAASDAARAFEGVLLQVYAGTEDAVASMMKLVDGAEENVRSVEGQELNVTYAFVKAASAEAAPIPQVVAETQPHTETETQPQQQQQPTTTASEPAATEPVAEPAAEPAAAEP
ncbi:hypothetical protein KEM52_005171, partial [Ascosphaera acerosa]